MTDAKEKRPFYIFLDVDGVLNTENTKERTPSGYTGIEQHYVAMLGELVEYFQATVILSSDWREEWEEDRDLCQPDGIYLSECLEEENIWIAGKIPTLCEDNRYRGEEIFTWLQEHEEGADYLVLDDHVFDFTERGHEELSRHVISTSGLNCCSPLVPDCTEAVREAIEILQIYK